ncbi:conserved protein of unknown function [Burkholderia multivorans]
MPPSDARSRSASPRHWLRAGVALAAVLALHGLAALWLSRSREAFTPLAPAEVPVQITLLKPQPIERQAAPAVRRTTAAAPRRTGPAHRAAPRPAPPAPAPVLASTQTAADGVPPPDGATPSHGDASGTGTGATGATAGAAATGAKFSVPPSGDLRYDSFFNGMQNSPGTIHWRTDGQTYDLSVSMPVPFVGPFRYRSQGRIDGFGIAPDRYVEQRGKRPEDIAIFNRDTKEIVFTRTPNSLALTDGAQDRFSMLMQLAGLLRAEPDAYRPGVTRQFFVVDNNSGETWPITVIGDENVRTRAGFVATRHFMRLPRRAGDMRRIDMWLAPSLGWLPARLVQTEPNGSQIELLWSGPLAAPETTPEAAPETAPDGAPPAPDAAPGTGDAPPAPAGPASEAGDNAP